jgi:hypothetical protein
VAIAWKNLVHSSPNLLYYLWICFSSRCSCNGAGLLTLPLLMFWDLPLGWKDFSNLLGSPEKWSLYCSLQLEYWDWINFYSRIWDLPLAFWTWKKCFLLSSEGCWDGANCCSQCQRSLHVQSKSSQILRCRSLVF